MEFVVNEPGIHKYVYGPTPPVGLEVALPLQSVLQVTLVDVAFGCNCGGCVIVTCPCAVQLFASVTVTVYVPGHKEEMDCELILPGCQRYEYGPTPPAPFAVAVPLHAPKQVIFVPDALENNCGGCVITTCPLPWHPFASVTETVYVPGQRPVAVGPVPPAGAQEYV